MSEKKNKLSRKANGGHVPKELPHVDARNNRSLANEMIKASNGKRSKFFDPIKAYGVLHRCFNR